MVIHWGPLSSWGYGLAPFQLGIWIGPFPIGDMDWPLSGWGYGPALFQLGMWTRPFPVGVAIEAIGESFNLLVP